MDDELKQKINNFAEKAKANGVPQEFINAFIKDKTEEHLTLKRESADRRQVVDLGGTKVLIDGDGNILNEYDVVEDEDILDAEFAESEANFSPIGSTYTDSGIQEPVTSSIQAVDVGQPTGSSAADFQTPEGDIRDDIDLGSSDGTVSTNKGTNIPINPLQEEQVALFPQGAFAEELIKLGVDPSNFNIQGNQNQISLPSLFNLPR